MMVAAAQALALGATLASGSQRKSCWLRKNAMAALTARAMSSALTCSVPTRPTRTRSRPVTR